MVLMKKTTAEERISICIPTFRRPAMLAKALSHVLGQVLDDTADIEMIVIDNDVARSAEAVVAALRKDSRFGITYDCEPERNISLARNRAIRQAKGDLIAFLDDDEFPTAHWLGHLRRMFRKTNADGVLGPVLPHFEEPPPTWIERGRLCERPRLKTGTLITDTKYMRTGNVLLSKRLLERDKEPFDPVFGRTGGGDIDFFARKLEAGHQFRWCDEAVVYETVPPERQKRSYFIKRAFTRGMVNAAREPFLSMGTAKSALAIVSYGLALPILTLFGQHVFMTYLIKSCDHLGKLLAYGRLNIVKNRPYLGVHPGQ